MQTKKNVKTQAQRLADALFAIKKDVTAEDRKAAESELSLTKATISKYFNGDEVMNNDTAVRLLTFFRKRISKREKAIT